MEAGISRYVRHRRNGTLLRGLAILELLAERGMLRAAEISHLLEMPRASAYRALAALTECGYVERCPDGKGYSLGAAVLRLVDRAERSMLVPLAAAAMDALARETRETVNLAALEGQRLVYVAIVDSSWSLRPSAEVGDAIPPHATAVGKAVLGRLSRSDREAITGPEPFPAYTGTTRTTHAELAEELEAAASSGYALDREETEVGASCVASPIIGIHGRPVGALSVSGLTARMPEDRLTALGADVRQFAELISAGLGGSAPQMTARTTTSEE
jgi:IclR family acetate operon transcriptional repressor